MMEKAKRSRWFAVAIGACALVICLALAGCGSSGSSSDSAAQSSNVANETATQQADSEEAAEESPVVIKKCTVGKDYGGDDTAVVTIQWKNASDSKAAFYTTYSVTAYVDGEEVDRTFGEGGGWYNDQKKIAAGKTQTFKAMFECDAKDDIEVEVTDWLDSDHVVAHKVFNG